MQAVCGASSRVLLSSHRHDPGPPFTVSFSVFFAVVKRVMLTPRNPARSMDYRADRHRTRAPINTRLIPVKPAVLVFPPTGGRELSLVRNQVTCL